MTKYDGLAVVAGGAGFLGSYVARALAEVGRPVVCLDVREPSNEVLHVVRAQATAIDFRHCDVTDSLNLDRIIAELQPEVVLHVAAIVNPPLLATDPILAYEVNTGGLVRMIRAARNANVRRLVYFSSIGVLPSVRYEPIDADHPVLTAQEGPGSGFYGASKVGAEAFCHAASTSFGLDCRIVRPSAVYGLGMQWPIFIKPIVEGAVRGEKVNIDHGGSFRRDYTHADDVASLAMAVLNAPADVDRVFYAATGRPLTTTSTLAGIVESLVPGAQISVADNINEEDRLESSYRGVLDIANATSQLGWYPRYASIEDGVAHYIRQYQGFLARSI